MNDDDEIHTEKVLEGNKFICEVLNGYEARKLDVENKSQFNCTNHKPLRQRNCQVINSFDSGIELGTSRAVEEI